MTTDTTSLPSGSIPERFRQFGAAELAVPAAAVGDLLTTYVILTSPDRTEGNVVLAALAEQHVALAMTAFVGFCAALVGGALLTDGWLADVAGSYVLLAMGFSCVNNAVAFATNVSILATLFADPGAAIAYGFPLGGLALGTARAYATRGTLPRTQVAAVWIAIPLALVAMPATLA